jgi:hypothetical protein
MWNHPVPVAYLILTDPNPPGVVIPAGVGHDGSFLVVLSFLFVCFFNCLIVLCFVFCVFFWLTTAVIAACDQDI